ncbi:hypothetical protein [Novosphingobium pentaromativorans]|uniref:ABC transporter permease n=1 Tax=Novosphingobium pentaromativorans US6-1 TaxID=1088721 RepID=G6EFG2_9SPHN|nr:hypothetical protein [Novosphingobium pentaromativorans]EHJ60006.1 hypothetical protein NSU_3082 [Novosphingobium pentaromativorans US6-1]
MNVAALWRSTPAPLRRETAALAALTPAILAAFAALWTMLPT